MRPVVFSYRWRRNPERLARVCACAGHVNNAREEERILRHLEHSPEENTIDLCLVMGGFMDGILGRAYAIAEELPDILGTGYDIYYREHDETASARRIVCIYGSCLRRIILIGHSWGASSLVRDVLPFCPNVCVNALITLDPVGIRRPEPLDFVRHWLNVYIPYEKAAWSRENNIARIGRPWEYVPYAEDNKIPSSLRHSDAKGMFEEFGAPLARRIALEQIFCEPESL